MSSVAGETKTVLLLQPELISNEYKELHGITKRTFTGGTKNLWLQIYSYLQPSYGTRIELKCLCRLFNDVEKMITFNPNCSPLTPIPRGSYTVYPHPNPKYSSLRVLFGHIKGSTNIPKMVLIENGIHDEGGKYVTIDIPISIIGESREHCIVIGGLHMRGKKEDDVNVSNLTLLNSKDKGVWNGVNGKYGVSMHLDNVSVENSGGMGIFVNGNRNTMKNCNVSHSKNCGLFVGSGGLYGASFHLDNVSVDNSGGIGIYVNGNRNTMKNCNVSHSKGSGLFVGGGGLMTIDGNGTTIHHNCTSGNGYGLYADPSSSIHLVPPLTVNEISKNNGGGGDSGGLGTITIISETKEDDDDSKKTYRLEANTIRLRF